MLDGLTQWLQDTLGSVMPPILVIFLVSMIPILELRGGLLVASAMGIPMWQAIPVCIIGNLIPVVLVLLFITPVFNLLKKLPFLRGIVGKLENKANGKHAGKIRKAEFIGLLLFVGIPLPGTGGWTGSLLASLLNVKFWKALVAVVLGLLLATAIMSAISYGIPWLVSLFGG